VVAAFRYEYPVDEMIRRLKYQGQIVNARVLGVLLAQAVRERGLALPGLLVPVPLHAARLSERGFNQSSAIARHAGRMLDIPVLGAAVQRIRDTPSQTSLDVNERRRNVAHAFRVVEGGPARRLLAVRHVAIVDDVTTTGSTLAELRGTLLAAGVERVEAWSVARTP